MLRAMKEWFEWEGITHTATLLINRHNLLKAYSMADLKRNNDLRVVKILYRGEWA